MRLVWSHLQGEEMSFLNDVYNNPLEAGVAFRFALMFVLAFRWR